MSQLFGMDEELENEGKNKVETMEEQAPTDQEGITSLLLMIC